MNTPANPPGSRSISDHNLTRVERFFFWLSAAGDQTLNECPGWERRKYVAFGATVLIPSLFAFIAAVYCLSTLTSDWVIILPIASVWAFIIMTVDRALLATYRAYQGFFRKTMQLALRLMVAALMGLTISHPLTLLLFRDTIHSSIERDREADVAQTRATTLVAKQQAEGRIAAAEQEINELRVKWNETFEAKFLVEDATAGTAPVTPEQARARAELDKKIAEATAPAREKIGALEKEIAAVNEQAAKTQTDLDYWQREFERELNGQRSGIVGLGPRAKSIESDQLSWRREESQRQAASLSAMTTQVSNLKREIAAQEQALTAQADAAAQEAAARINLEQNRIANLKRQVQQSQADSFVSQQNLLRESLKEQMDARLDQSQALRDDLAGLISDEQTRIAAIHAEPRRDILTQTLALHKLFDNGAQGGLFALITYCILTLLFLLVDTIPLVIKFFSKPGPYDTLVDCDEIRFEKERETFLKSYRRYMDELASGRLLHLTRNKPLEQALIEGVDRSRAAKEFLEHLLELEHTFNERILRERQALAQEESSSGKAEMLEELAQAFYADLRRRMERFFEHDDSARAAS